MRWCFFPHRFHRRHHYHPNEMEILMTIADDFRAEVSNLKTVVASVKSLIALYVLKLQAATDALAAEIAKDAATIAALADLQGVLDDMKATDADAAAAVVANTPAV